MKANNTIQYNTTDFLLKMNLLQKQTEIILKTLAYTNIGKKRKDNINISVHNQTGTPRKTALASI